MTPNRKIEHEFVDFIPREMEEDKLYISIEFATASHRCFCGCGSEVVTPLSPAGWQLTFDGETVSLTPSVGSWSLPCKSHYIIRKDTIVWAGLISDAEIEAVKRRDQRDLRRHLGLEPPPSVQMPSVIPAPQPKLPLPKQSFWEQVRRLFR